MKVKFLVVAMCLAFSGSAMASEKGGKSSGADTTALQKPFVTVNGLAIPVVNAELLFREQIARGAKDSADLRNAVREMLVLNALVEQEAKKSGLDKNPLLQAQAEMAKQAVFNRAWELRVMSEANVSDTEVAAEYERQMARLGTTEYRLRQILVSDETTAKLLQEKASSPGSKFDALAREYSKDPAAKENGGLSDWVNAGNLLPTLADAVSKLTKGKLAAAPIQTPNGWHVVQLEDMRPFKAPSLEDARQQVVQILRQKALEERVKALRAKAKVQ